MGNTRSVVELLMWIFSLYNSDIKININCEFYKNIQIYSFPNVFYSYCKDSNENLMKLTNCQV